MIEDSTFPKCLPSVWIFLLSTCTFLSQHALSYINLPSLHKLPFHLLSADSLLRTLYLSVKGF
jgi:hypothetical protein